MELAASTLRAVAALEERQAIIERLPTAHAVAAASLTAASLAQPSHPAPSPTTPAYRTPGTVPAAASSVPATARTSSQLSLQSVLAVAGAGLFAIAAIFFTFFSEELEGQQDLRTVIVAVTTVVFLVGAWMLTRTGLTFSGETVGALGMVFVALDVWLITRYAQGGLSDWSAVAIATLVAAVLLIAVALFARIRTWLWTGVVALAVVPAFFGYGADVSWYSILGHLGTGFAALAVVAALPTLSSRFGASLRAERLSLVAIRLVLLPIVAVQLLVLRAPQPLDDALTAAGVILALAVLSALSTRDSLPRLWSLGAGGLAATAAAVVPLAATDRIQYSWLIALVPLSALAALIALNALVQLGSPQRGRLHRITVLVGAWIVTVVVAVPAGLSALAVAVVPADVWGISDSTTATFVGVCAPFVAGLVLTVLAPRVAGTVSQAVAMRSVASASAAWFGMYAVLAMTSIGAIAIEGRLAIGIGAAVITALLVWRAPRVATAPPRIRIPLMVGAHVILLHALAQAWTEGVAGTVAQCAIVAAIVVLSFAVPHAARPLHIGAAMTLALFVFSGALGEYTDFGFGMILALTATLGLAVAIAATMVRALRTEFWYAILIVIAVPSILSVAGRLYDDSGWIALTAGAGAVLGLALLVVQRPGHRRELRAVGGAIILPALAVVVTGVVPLLTTTSGSPIVLPIVAGLVAVTLPFTVAIGRRLERLGIDPAEARIARLAIEASALATAGIAVIIAVLRPAAGFDTTFLVLAIVGLGGAATALFSNRAYGWVISYAAWSGALWSLFALWSVDVVEPYVLPPAIAAVIIGGVGVFRGRPGQWMVIAGLVLGALPSLALLLAERGDDTAYNWRLWGLLGASILLLGLGFLFARVSRLGSLRVPVLAVAMLTAAAGPIGALNLGIDRAVPAPGDVTYDIMPVLALAALGAVLAAIGARLIGLQSSRWLYLPALTYLLVGTAAGIRADAVSVWTLFGLMVVYLVGMVVVVLRTRTRASTLPPAWVWFGFAWVASVVSWSQREVLRVEGFSIPMAVALLAAGIIAWRSRELPGTIHSWPVGFSGSWALLGPGLFVLFVPSILATFTTPETWRAVFVIVLALVAILLGSRLKLAAPFIGGIAVLPLENIVVFAVQSSRDIQSTPWWITLASAGAVLLVIAVTSERRASGGGIAARIRDLD